MNTCTKILKMGLSWITLFKYKILYGNRFQCSWTDMISPSVKIRIDSNGKVIIGKRVGLREQIIINSTGGVITIGDRVFINDFSCINAREKVTIGSGSVIGQGVKIYDHDHDYKHDMQKEFICAPVEIGQNVWIGSDAILLKGTNIGENAVVGAMTLINRNVPSFCIAVNERTSRLKMMKE